MYYVGTSDAMKWYPPVSGGVFLDLIDDLGRAGALCSGEHPARCSWRGTSFTLVHDVEGGVRAYMESDGGLGTASFWALVDPVISAATRSHERIGAIGDVSIGPWLASPLGAPYAWGQALGWWGQRRPSDIFPHVSEVVPHEVSETARQFAQSAQEAARAASKVPEKLAELPGDVAARMERLAREAEEKAAQTIKTIAVVGGVVIVGAIVLTAIAKKG